MAFASSGARFPTSLRVVGDAPSALMRPLLSGPTAANETWKVYYYAGAQMMAMRVLTGTTGNTLYYLHSDHLGSTSLVTCGNSACGTMGSVVARQWYHPYGSVRASSGALPTDIGFTAQRLDSTGLMYFRARYYSGVLGRFISADTIVPGAGNPQALNRYSFVLNNPLRYIDPSGHACEKGPFAHESCDDGGGVDYGSGEPLDPGLEIPAGCIMCNGGVDSGLLSSQEEPVGPITWLLLQLPGTSDQWANAATAFDVVAWGIDLYATGVVTYGGIGGASIPAALLPAGVPEVPVVTGLAGMGIAELYAQPALRAANTLATVSMALTIVADTKAGNTRIEQGVLGSDAANSITLTILGWLGPEAYSSLIMQSTAIANDFDWISFPWPDYSRRDQP